MGARVNGVFKIVTSSIAESSGMCSESLAYYILRVASAAAWTAHDRKRRNPSAVPGDPSGTATQPLCDDLHDTLFSVRILVLLSRLAVH